jgi:hypothetical protein
MAGYVSKPDPIVLRLYEKLARLQNELDIAFLVADQQSDPAFERARYQEALRAIGNFLEAISLDRHSAKLLDLAIALADLDHGATAPMLQPRRIENRAPAPTKTWIGRAHVALSIEAFAFAGESREAAAAHIAKEVPALATLATKKAKTLRTVVLSWYSEFNRGRVKNDLARKVFEVGRSFLREYEKQPTRLITFSQIARNNLMEAVKIASG